MMYCIVPRTVAGVGFRAAQVMPLLLWPHAPFRYGRLRHEIRSRNELNHFHVEGYNGTATVPYSKVDFMSCQNVRSYQRPMRFLPAPCHQPGDAVSAAVRGH